MIIDVQYVASLSGRQHLGLVVQGPQAALPVGSPAPVHPAPQILPELPCMF